MTPSVKPIPEGYHTVSPYLVIKNAAAAIEFYKKAFGARERGRMSGPDGRLMHAEIQIGDSIVMIHNEMLEYGSKSPQTLGGSPINLFLYVPDADASFQQAVSAGAQVTMPLADMFWGDRYGKLVDPFGHEWSIATHKEDLTPEEIERRGREAMSKSAGA